MSQPGQDSNLPPSSREQRTQQQPNMQLLEDGLSQLGTNFAKNQMMKNLAKDKNRAKN